MKQTLEQVFAKKIYEQVDEYHNNPLKADKEKYESMAHKLPILVRTAGLTQALAFVDSRKEEPFRDLLEHLAQVVAECDREQLLEQSRNAELQEYIYLTRKTMLALKWYKRFAQSVLEDEATEADGKEG